MKSDWKPSDEFWTAGVDGPERHVVDGVAVGWNGTQYGLWASGSPVTKLMKNVFPTRAEALAECERLAREAFYSAFEARVEAEKNEDAANRRLTKIQAMRTIP